MSLIKKLESYLNELYSGSSIIPNYHIQNLEQEVFKLHGIDIKILIFKIDNVFCVDEATEFDKILKTINLIPLEKDNFSIKFIIK